MARVRFLENKICTLATQASQWSEWQSKPHLSSPHHPSTPIHIPSTHTLSHPHRCTLSAIAITYHHRYAITGMPSPSPASKPVRQPASQTARCTPPTATPVHQPDRGGGSVLSSKRWGLRGVEADPWVLGAGGHMDPFLTVSPQDLPKKVFQQGAPLSNSASHRGRGCDFWK